MKKILVLHFFVIGSLTTTFGQAQNSLPAEVSPQNLELFIEPKEAPEEYHAKGLLHQIYLEDAVESLDGLEYEKDGQPLKGKLSEDKKRIIIENYEKRGSVKVTVTMPSGEQKTINKSSCYVDVVIPL